MIIDNIIAFRALLALLLVSVPHIACAESSLETDNQELPSAEKIYSSYIEHNGGRANMAALNTFIASGRVEFEGVGLYAFRIVRKQPNKFRQKVDYTSYTKEILSNGEQAWSIVTAPNQEDKVVELVGDKLSDALANSSMGGPFFRLAGQYEKFHAEAFEDVRGKPAIRVEIDPSVGMYYDTVWLSTEHFQEVKLAFSNAPGEAADPIQTEIYFSNFDKNAGVYYAKEIDYVVDGLLTQKIYIDRIRANVGLFNSYFEK